MRTALLAAVTAGLLTACGAGSDGTGSVRDPAPTSAPPTSVPTATPTVGTYPAYQPRDYAFTLRVACFCADTGTPIRVTVADGKVVDAVYTKSDRGHHSGDRAPRYRRLTIDDVIAAANDTSAARVEVTWPSGQDYPDSVFVDPDAHTIDEEVGYTLSQVAVGVME